MLLRLAPPKVLVVPLKRFQLVRGSLVKNDKEVLADEYIRVGGATFRLSSFVQHIGSSLSSGHYVCYARNEASRW